MITFIYFSMIRLSGWDINHYSSDCIQGVTLDHIKTLNSKCLNSKFLNSKGRHPRPRGTRRSPAGWRMGERTSKPSRCCNFKVFCGFNSFIFFHIYDLCHTNIFYNYFRSGDAVYVAEIGPNRLRKFEVPNFNINFHFPKI